MSNEIDDAEIDVHNAKVDVHNAKVDVYNKKRERARAIERWVSLTIIVGVAVVLVAGVSGALYVALHFIAKNW